MWQTKNNQYSIKIAGKGTLRPEKQVGFFLRPSRVLAGIAAILSSKTNWGMAKGVEMGRSFFHPLPPNPFFSAV